MTQFSSLALASLLTCRGETPRVDVPIAPPVTFTTAAPFTAAPPPSLPAVETILTYTERGGDQALSFRAPHTVRLRVASGRSCDTELGESGNLWTWQDVVHALEEAEVREAVEQNALYLSSSAELRPVGPSQLATPTGKITWLSDPFQMPHWTEPPPAEPGAVHHAQEMLHTIMSNRMQVCAE